ncbi:MAG TPA: HPr(Ser) kinase/phosphatase, partial [Burkholderiales bacterium]|nr:HPr(Ser) kinase/phosphatase [Burkholderiales bacterium]
MTTPILTVENLFQNQGEELKLKWVAGRKGAERLLEPITAKYPGMALVGHLNFVHPNRVQVLGDGELAYLQRQTKAERARSVKVLFSAERTTTVIVASKRVPADMVAAADRHKRALFSTALPSPVVIDHLQYYLARALAPRITIHGVYMEVMGMGLLITGESGIGKSELALELLSRNHRLISDDAVELIRVGPDVVVGQSPHALSDYLEVRGLGILDVRMMFGETAVRHKKKLHVIVHLEKLDKKRMVKVDRLAALSRTRKILEVDVPEVVLYVAPGRNLAVLVEAATRAYILRTWGINPVDDFMDRHRALMNGEKPVADKPRKR